MMIGLSTTGSGHSAAELFASGQPANTKTVTAWLESFTLRDNLMLEGGVIASGGCLIAVLAAHVERYTCLAAFERCVSEAAGLLHSDQPGGLTAY